MQLYVQAHDLKLLDYEEEEAVDVAILPIFADERPLWGFAGLIDWRCHGYLSNLLRKGVFSGQAYESLLLPVRRISWVWRIVLLGLGEHSQFYPSVASQAASQIVDIAHKLGAQRVLCALPGMRWGEEIPMTLFLALKAALQAYNESVRMEVPHFDAPPVWRLITDPEQVQKFTEAL